MSDEKDFTKLPADDAPPILKSWNQLYGLVLIIHALIITAFYIFTRIYS